MKINKLIKIGCFCTLALILGTYIPLFVIKFKPYPETVYIHNKSKYNIDYVINDLEQRDGINFLTDKNSGSVITIIDLVLPKGILGYAEPSLFSGNCTIELDTEISWDEIPFTIRHEIGHCFGLMHNEYNKKDIMYPYDTYEQRSSESLQKFSEDLKTQRLK